MIAIPTWLVILAAVLAVLLVIGLWAYFTAARLNRLHIRTDSARLTLEGALHARAMLIATLRPDLKKQADRVSRVPLQATDMGAHSEAENSLLMALDATVIEHPAFIAASTRVDLASRFYNDAVWDTRQLRSRAGVRALKLAGFAPIPEFYEAATTDHVA